MNTHMVSLNVLFSYSSSCAIELEYRLHVIILTYGLEYSLCVIILTCASYDMIMVYELDYSSYGMVMTYRTLCLIVRATYINRVRVMLRWWFVVPSGYPCSSSMIRRVRVCRGHGLFLHMRAWCPDVREPSDMTVYSG